MSNFLSIYSCICQCSPWCHPWHLSSLGKIINKIRMTIFPKIFSRLQQKSVSNLDTLHHKTQFLTKLTLFWCIFLSKFIKIPMKIRKFVVFFKHSRLLKIILSFQARCDFSEYLVALRNTVHIWYIYEPQHDKTNKMSCASSKDSDQPGHQPSLIRVFAVRMKKLSVTGGRMCTKYW